MECTEGVSVYFLTYFYFLVLFLIMFLELVLCPVMIIIGAYLLGGISMNQTKTIRLITGCAVFAAGVIGVALFRGNAIAEDASAGAKLYFALCAIAAVIGCVSTLKALFPAERKNDVRTTVFAAMFAALSYVGFAYLKIDIPVGTSSTAFHLGNVFVVLAALFLGGYWGGMAGAVGLTIADLTTQYVTSAPKTFILKLCIGLITGFVAHNIFGLNKKGERKIPVAVAALVASLAGMGFNVVADPIVGYFYKQYLLGVPQEIAKVWAKIGAITTLVNAVIAVIMATVFYLALRGPLNRTGLLAEK